MKPKFSKEQINYLEKLMGFSCCHITGMHDPGHYRKREYICQSQISEAFKRACKELGINPKTKSKDDCFWCNRYPLEKDGEGKQLFEKEDSS